MTKLAKNIKPATIVAKLHAAMVARRAALAEGGFTVSAEITKKNGILDNFDAEGNAYKEFVTAVEKTQNIFNFGFMLSNIQKHKPAGSSDVNYMQCKTIEKILKFVKAIAYQDFRMLDTHTANIMFNAMCNHGMISAQGAFGSLVKVEFDLMSNAASEMLVKRANYTTGTGSTQLSSTREMFRIVGLCDGVKGAKDAPIVFTEEAKNALIEHFDDIAKRVGRSASDDADVPETEDEEMTEE